MTNDRSHPEHELMQSTGKSTSLPKKGSRLVVASSTDPEPISLTIMAIGVLVSAGNLHLAVRSRRAASAADETETIAGMWRNHEDLEQQLIETRTLLETTFSSLNQCLMILGDADDLVFDGTIHEPRGAELSRAEMRAYKYKLWETLDLFGRLNYSLIEVNEKMDTFVSAWPREEKEHLFNSLVDPWARIREALSLVGSKDVTMNQLLGSVYSLKDQVDEYLRQIKLVVEARRERLAAQYARA